MTVATYANRFDGYAGEKFEVNPKVDTRGGMVCVEFPWPAGAHPRGGDRPPKVWVTLRRDGSIVVPRTRIGDRFYVPAGPGIEYLASSNRGHILLRTVAARRR